MKGFIVSASSTILENETYVELHGRLENGESFLVLNKLNPYFFIRKKDVKNVSSLLKKFKVEEKKYTNFEGEEVVKISASLQAELTKLFQAIHHKVQTYEADIRPHLRFIIDNDILGCIDIEGHYESSEKIDRIYKNPQIKPCNFIPSLKIISIDTESDKKTGKLFCIGIYSKNYPKNFIVSNKELKNSISCKTEEECLIKFKEELIKLDPDIITGWNVIDFDLVYLREKFAKYKIPFDIGRTNETARIRIESSFFKSSSVDIPGRQVLDGINLIRDPFIQEAPSIRNAEFESYTLEDVSQAILGSGKLLKGKDRHNIIEELYNKGDKESLQKLIDYNLNDCYLVYQILIKTKIIELIAERSQLTGLPLDRITASIAAFDSLYIREARKRNLVSPTTIFSNKEERIKGGYVSSLKSGIYSNVLILDFKSLYPSIIKTFNIDPASFLEKKEKLAIESPNKAYFKNQDGILPQIIEKLHQEREKAKKEKRELASYAIKIIMNSFFGVLANPNCRYFNLKMANAITHFGQMIIQLTAKEIEKKGYKVIYLDTDSCFVETNTTKEKAEKLGNEISVYINNFYNEYVKKNYKRRSYLELQFAKLYLSLMIPSLRGSETAAKKRYAGLIEKDGKEEIEVTGLEAIRGDWTEAAQEFQIELLKKLFKKEPIEEFIKSYIKKIKSGKMDDKLIYRKSIRKELSEYTKTTPPHVKAARKLQTLDSNIIQYYITTDGPEPIQKLKHKIDYDHYIEKQIKPIANQILILLNKSFEDIAQSSKQAKLF